MEKLSVKDAKERLNVAENTIRRMIQRGDLPNVERVKRKIWIPLSDIEAYEQKRAAAAASKKQAKSAAAIPRKANAKAKKPPKAEQSETPSPEPESKEVAEPVEAPEAEEAVVVSDTQEETPEPASMPTPKPRSTIAQPIDELDDGGESVAPPEPSSEPVPYSSGAVQTHGEHEQSFKWVAVQAGILGTKWLEEIFHSIRITLEKYKKKSFPQSNEK